jgi:peptidoglycan hydrolase-like protein with peptidoglycan-binding domain
MKSAPPPAEAQTALASSAPTTTGEESPIGPEPQAMLNRRVQTALNQAGYGPIAVDGYPGSETADAIRRFELDNGLPITGEVGDRLIARLVAVGAMSAP